MQTPAMIATAGSSTTVMMLKLCVVDADVVLLQGEYWRGGLLLLLQNRAEQVVGHVAWLCWPWRLGSSWWRL
jgi:hypothetical protein